MGEILFIAHRIPYPPDRGDKIRSWHIVQALARIAPVHVAAFADDDRDLGFASALDEVVASRFIVKRDMPRLPAAMRGLWAGRPLSLSLFDHPALHTHVGQVLNERPVSAVFVYSGQMAQYVPALPPGVPFIMDFCDCDSAKFAAYGRGNRGPMGWIGRREATKLLAFERQTAMRANISLFVSEAEAALFRAASGIDAATVRVLENGVDSAHFSPAAAFPRIEPEQREQGPLIVFTGQMDYAPNVEAAVSFARSSLPVIRARHPGARFAIVGRNPARAVRALAKLPGVLVTGAVPDVRGWLAVADLVVAPLRIARGIQNKVLEAMAMARPTLVSPEAAEGIDAVDGRHFVIAGADAEAGAASALLADPERAGRIGVAARARIEQRYGWDAALAPLPGFLGFDAQRGTRRVSAA